MKVERVLFSMAVLLFAACATPSPSVENPQLYQNPATNKNITPEGASSLAGAGVGTAVTSMLDKNRPTPAKAFLRGHCIVVDSGLQSPCASMLILLKDNSDGETIRQERTDSQGDFVFPVEAGKSYRLGVMSTHFKMSFDSEPPFNSGSNVVVKLQAL